MKYLYYTNRTVGENKIGRVGQDGTANEPDWLTPASGNVSCVAVDDTYVYWGNQSEKYIGRAKLDGTGADPKWVQTTRDIRGLVVTSAYIYFLAYTGYIGRCNIAGGEVNNSFIATSGQAHYSLATDGVYLYWGDWGNEYIGRAKLDGTGVEQPWVAAAGRVTALTIDTTYVYYGRGTAKNVGRVNLDGSGQEDEWLTGLAVGGGTEVGGLAVTWSHIYISFLGGGGDIDRAEISGLSVESPWVEVNKELQSLAVLPGELTPPSAPEASSPGAIEGVPVAGETLTAGEPGWVEEPEEETWQWERWNEETEEWEEIPGATGKEYEPTEEDEGKQIRVCVTGTNGPESTTVCSDPTGLIEGFVQGTLGSPHGFPDWQPWNAREPTPLYSSTGLAVAAATTLGPMYVGAARAVDILMQQTEGEGALKVELQWHVTSTVTEPYITQTLYLHPGEGELHQQVPSEADHLTIVLTPLAEGGEATYRILVQSTESTVSERRYGDPLLLSAAAVEVPKEGSVEETLARTAPGPATLTVTCSGEGTGRTLTLEKLSSKGEWVRYLGFPLADNGALTSVSIELPSSPVRAKLGNTGEAAVDADLAIGI